MNSRRGSLAGQPARATSANVFDNYLATESEPADGFDFPVGNADGKGAYVDTSTGKRYDGWYIATNFAEEYSLGIHPGEDWNGTGGGDTDLGQSVHAVANGRVVFAQDCGRLWGNVIIVEHTFYENHEKLKIRSLYAHLLEIKVASGKEVRRRQVIATVGQDPEKTYHAHLHLELRWDDALPPTYWPTSEGKDQAWVREHYASPSDFIQKHRKSPLPRREESLVLVDQESYKMRLYRKGQMQGEYEVSFGQGKGRKRVQGDNKTPMGMYFVIQKHRGEFSGPYGTYYGGHWIKINYPNKYDAAWGRAERIISLQQEATINASWKNRALTKQDTGLGGGIGFHGWIKEWDAEGPRHLSWGCVVMHIYDIKRLYEQIPEGAMVVIF
ncbi:MAG: peptidoglycan DD-metalloendopeptidase family protein [Pyrinomonadaceae bacterium]|nr:peptidoglycan DD-metalloendopeptidase family protein [Pyrinomonadaceae bacterium]